MIGIWTGKVLPYLTTHSGYAKKRPRAVRDRQVKGEYSRTHPAPIILLSIKYPKEEPSNTYHFVHMAHCIICINGRFAIVLVLLSSVKANARASATTRKVENMCKRT